MRFLLIVAGMLALAVSASLTPANAGGPPPPCRPDQVTAWAHMFGVSPSLMLESYCFCQCNNDAGRRIHTETPTSNHKKTMACNAQCVNAFEASRR
jgi:hypothetical protein